MRKKIDLEKKKNCPSNAQDPFLSVIVPIYNEADGLGLFFAKVEPILEDLAAAHGRSYEIICVDDGSGDETYRCLTEHRRRNPAIRILRLSRNFGKEAALSAGLDSSVGDAVVPIDADLQDPPELIPAMVDKWLEGYDVVYAVRRRRRGDGAIKRLTARAFYRLYNRLADTAIPFDTGDFRLLDRRVVDALGSIPERSRFMKGLFTWVGFHQIGIPYDREPRASGTSKWVYWRLWNFAIDGITSSSTVPLRIWSYIGVLLALCSFFYGGFLILRTLVLGADAPGYASIMTVMLFLGGVQLLTLGILGEYLGRAYIEVKRRPLYILENAKDTDLPNRPYSVKRRRVPPRLKHTSVTLQLDGAQ